jgi:uncharacterized protein (TIGR03435 family)
MPNAPIVFSSNRPALIALLAAVFLGIALPIARAQTTQPPAAAPDAKPLAFDVISIKPNKTGTTMIGEGVMGAFTVSKFTHDGFSSANITLKSLIAIAYGIREYLISGGPSWIGSTRYDIEAKNTDLDVPNSPSLTKAQRNQMIQSLLTERFRLLAHLDTKDGAIYELVVAQHGPKLQEAKSGDPNDNALKNSDGIPIPTTGLMMTKPGQFTGQSVSISSLVDLLSPLLQRNIINKTGLTGKYAMTLQYTPDNGADTDPSDANALSIFNALEEQLGLKLASAKGPVKTLVIDHVEQPSSN